MSPNSEKDSSSSSCSVVEESPAAVNNEIPDGGRDAWLVLLGSSLANLASFGIVNSFGTFQDYYTSQLLPESSSSAISIIGAFQLFLIYGLGPIVGRIFDAYGITLLLRGGSVVLVLSTMLIPFCKEFYQFFLVQGLMFGLGSALIFTPCMAVLGHWFRRRRALAMGIVGATSAIGGVAFSTMIQQLIPRVGFAWAVRITGFLSLTCLCVAFLTVKTRLPLKKSLSLKGMIDFNGFRDTQYTLAAIGSFLYFYAYFIPYFYIQVYATEHGIDPRISNYLLVIINALGVPSRIIPGFLADRFGVLEVLVPCTIIPPILVLVLWLPFPASGPIVAFSALYGLFSGSFLPLLPAYIATRTPVDKFGARLGSLYIFVGIACLVGTPTAGAFLPAFTQKNFDHLIIFTGVMMLFGGIIFFICYLLALRERKLTKDSTQASEVSETRSEKVDMP